jgi:sec-independent protein translocase protein TatA
VFWIGQLAINPQKHYMLQTVLLWALGTNELIIILIIIILLFGARKIPDLMRGIGKGFKEYKDATKDDKEKDKQSH